MQKRFFPRKVPSKLLRRALQHGRRYHMRRRSSLWLARAAAVDPANCQEEKHLIDVFNAVKLLIPWISKFGTFVAEIHTHRILKMNLYWYL